MGKRADKAEKAQSLGEKITESVSNLLHPEASADIPKEDSPVAADESIAPPSDVSMQDHPKFHKFKNVGVPSND
jgi:hypothetical protein